MADLTDEEITELRHKLRPEVVDYLRGSAPRDQQGRTLVEVPLHQVLDLLDEVERRRLATRLPLRIDLPK